MSESLGINGRVKRNSIAVKLNLLLLAFLVPLVILLIASIAASRRSLISQVRMTHAEMCQTYMDQVDDQLHQAQSNDVNLALFSNEVQIISLDIRSAAAQYAQTAIVKDFEASLSTAHYITGFFLMCTDQQGEEVFLHRASSTVTMEDRHHMQKALAETLHTHELSSAVDTGVWQPFTADGREYLLHMTRNGSDIAAGAYVDLSALLAALRSPTEYAVFRLSTQEPVTLESGVSFITVKSKTADLYLSEAIQDSWLTASLPIVQQYLPVIGLFLVLLPFFCTFLVHRIVISPLNRLTADIDHIHSGDLDYRIPERGESNEIQVVNRALNAMVDEIQNLKVHVYEAALNEQKARLRNLQLQIRPHFLINSLNMIYNSIESGKEKQACQLILHTTDYFRYMERIQENLVPLQDEIKHISDYLDIQALRYEGRIEREISVDPMIADMLIPPVLIQCFIENAVKYALNMEQKLKIQVRVTAFEKEFSPYAKIEIGDNGGGFPPELLEQINAGKRIHDERGSHTGISNVIQRLSLIFGDQASWSFYNALGAAAVFTLPATFADEENEA